MSDSNQREIPVCERVGFICNHFLELPPDSMSSVHARSCFFSGGEANCSEGSKDKGRRALQGRALLWEVASST